jgi:archaellum component FlaC
MLSEKDLSQLKKVFATKADIKLAVSDFVTKKEHNRHFDYLVANMATKEDLRKLESRFDTLEENFSKVMNSVDGLSSILADIRQELAFSVVQYQRQLE